MVADLRARCLKVLERSDFSGKLLLTGDFIIDRYIFGSVDRISPEAPVPILNYSSSEKKLGGAANVLANLSQLKNGSAFDLAAFSKIGCNAEEAWLASEVKKLCKRDYLCELGEYSSPVKSRYIAKPFHQILRLDQEKKNTIPFEASFLEELLLKEKDFDCFVIQDYVKGALLDSELLQIMDRLKSTPKKIIIDPHVRRDPSLYKGATLLLPNLAEARFLLKNNFENTDQASEKAIVELKENFDLQACLLTRASAGATLIDKKNVITHIPALEKKAVFDVTGAGDSVLAALAFFWSSGVDLLTSACLAMAAASHAVSQVGCASLERQQLQKIIEDL